MVVGSASRLGLPYLANDSETERHKERKREKRRPQSRSFHIQNNDSPLHPWVSIPMPAKKDRYASTFCIPPTEPLEKLLAPGTATFSANDERFGFLMW